jgi:predicted negative regulator of RcsB-dependent stress response
MAQTLDLEEQEQLDQIRHFWQRYGNVITWLLIIVFGSIAAWNGWQYWQHRQAMGASVLFSEVERAVADKDSVRMERALSDLKNQYGSTVFAQQGALLAAKGLFESGAVVQAKQSLEWAAAQSQDDGLQAIARLRLAGLALEQGTADEARKWIDVPMPAEFAGLVTDRQGDVLSHLGQSAEAKQAYLKAYKAFDAGTEYRRLVEVKLNALGVDPAASNVKP